MPLLDSEVERLRGLGHSDFTHADDEGYIRLRNIDGRCVFHDGLRCTIYDNRPLGCRSYPVVYSLEDKKAVHDSDCPHTDSFPISEKNEETILLLVHAIDEEARVRKLKK